jgi:hypothetical protein
MQYGRRAFGAQRRMSETEKARNIAESITAHRLTLTQETWARYGIAANETRQQEVRALLATMQQAA